MVAGFGRTEKQRALNDAGTRYQQNNSPLLPDAGMRPTCCTPAYWRSISWACRSQDRLWCRARGVTGRGADRSCCGSRTAARGVRVQPTVRLRVLIEEGRLALCASLRSPCWRVLIARIILKNNALEPYVSVRLNYFLWKTLNSADGIIHAGLKIRLYAYALAGRVL